MNDNGWLLQLVLQMGGGRANDSRETGYNILISSGVAMT